VIRAVCTLIAVIELARWLAGRAWMFVGGWNVWKPGGED
jgi:hypothetical protein